MPLQTVKGYDISPDYLGAIDKGLNLANKQTNQEFLGQKNKQALALGDQRLALGNQKSQILEQANNQELKKQAMQRAAYAVTDSLYLPDDQKLDFWKSHKAKVLADNPNAVTTESDRMISTYASGNYDEGNKLAKGAYNSFVSKGFIKPQAQEYQLKQAQLDLVKQRTKSLKEKSLTTDQSNLTANIQDEQYYQKLKKEDPDRAKQFGQDVGLVSKEGRELSGHAQKNLTNYIDAAVVAQNLGGEFEYLASEFEKLDPVAGAAGTAHEFLKTITGSEDAVSEARRKYMKIRASQVVKNLPPGAASEKDVALALSGFPEPDANSKHMASFLRGLSKLQAFDEKYNRFKAEFLSEKGHERGMLKAWEDQHPKKTKAVNWGDL